MTVGQGFSVGEKLVLGWAGLRGAVPVVFATFAVTEGIEGGLTIFNVTFFVVLLSTVLQGTTIEPVARLLGVQLRRGGDPGAAGGAGPAQPARRGGRSSSPCARATRWSATPVRELGLPREALLNVVVRGERAIPPRGSTVVEAGDQLHVIVRQEAAVEFRELLRRWRDGPLGRARAPAAEAAQPPVGDDGAAVGGRRRRSRRARRASPGRVVVDQLRTRRDEPGALVLLDDGRYAITGRCWRSARRGSSSRSCGAG